MGAATKKQVDLKILQDLVPFSELSDAAFSELAKKIVIEEVRARRYLFRKGDRDNQCTYLLAGRLNLVDGRKTVVSELEGRTDACRYPLDNHQPHTLSARAITKVLVARVDSSLLEAFLAGNSASSTEVKEIKADENEDWMTHILQSEAVKKIPPSNIQQLLIKLEPFEVQAGDVIFSQGDEGTHFYTIHKGQCEITCTDAQSGEKKRICELSDSHSFGEEALVLNTRRNATVSMLSDGLLLRLPKDDFLELMQKPLVRFVPYDKAVAMVEDDAVWVDVREPGDYENDAIEDSVNIPLYSLRSEIAELVFNAKYIICCENGQRSISAAFILSHRGFDVYVLEGGLEAVASTAATVVASAEPVELPAMAAGDETEASQAGEHADSDEPGEVNSRLATEAGQLRQTEQRRNEQLEQMRAELAEANERMAEFYSRSKADTDEKRALQDRLAELEEASAARVSVLEQKLLRSQEVVDASQGQQHAQIEQLQVELEQARERLAAGETAAATVTEQHTALQQDSEAALQERQTQIKQLQAELGQARERLAADETVAATVTEQHTALQQDSEAALQERQAQIKQLQAELEQAREQLAAGEAAAAAVTGEHEVQKQQFEAAQQEQQALIARIQDDLGHAGQQVENLQAELAGVRQEQQSSASETQTALTESQERVRELTTELQGEAQRANDLDTGNAGLQQQVEALKAQYSAAEEKSRELEAAVATAEQARQEEQEQLFATVSDRDNVQQLVESLQQDNSRLQDESRQLQVQLEERAKALAADKQTVASELEKRQGEWEKQRTELEGQFAALTGSADDQTRVLQSRINELEQHGSEKDSGLQALQDEISAQQAAVQKLEEENKRLHEGYAEKLQIAADTEERLQALEQDYQAAIHKAKEDTAGKDAIEQELQGQVERLRKQLEQASSESTEVRKSVQGDVEQLREELNAERRARDEERADMAARQRQLKEQLATIAREHEDNLSRHEKALRSASDSARREERERLQQELERREKDQPAAETGQLESRIAELERENGATRKEQLAALDKLNLLQAELDAKSSGGEQQHDETIAALHAKLEESKQDLEISERLRCEAELAREQLVAELDALPAEPEEELILEAMEVPSLDDGDEGVSHPGPPATIAIENTGGQQAGKESAGKSFKYAVDPGAGRPNLLGWGLGLGVAGIVAAVIFWVTSGTSIQFQDMSDVIDPVAVSPDPPVVESTPAAANAPAAPEAVPDENTVMLTVAPGRVFRDTLKSGGRGPSMVELPSASFPMGSAGNSLNFDEGPRHYVTLNRFSIGKHEVTFAEYDRFARDTGRRLPYDEEWGRGDRPVINVSWKDANVYADWLSGQTGRTYRLPTEAQWEFAARAGTTGNYWWDRNEDVVRANCFACGSQWDGDRTAPVSNFAANPFGIHDTAGNVQEWTQDCYRAGYRDAAADGSAWQVPECTQQVVRGGSYSSPLDSLRSSKRSQYDQDTRLDNLGFRVVRVN